MDLLADPQVWVSFLTLVVLEIVLGIDNIIFLSLLVDRLPKLQRGSARILGLGFAMLTRIALLFSITWLATLRDPLFRALGTDVSGRDLILFAGGLFLIVKTVMEMRDMLQGKVAQPQAWSDEQLCDDHPANRHHRHRVFARFGVHRGRPGEAHRGHGGCDRHLGAGDDGGVRAVSRFIERYPTIKVLALAFLVLVGAALIAESLELRDPAGIPVFRDGIRSSRGMDKHKNAPAH